MARNQRRPEAASELRLEPLHDLCGACGERSWVAYHGTRTVTTLEGSVRLRLVVRRCVNRECELYQESRRLEQEGAFALPQGEFGLDVIALVGALRHAEHRSVPEIHRELLGRGVGVSERTVTNLLDRYEELMALRLSDRNRLREALERQGRAILALDGLQPDVGHEVLWVVRECLSGEVLLARSLLSGTEESLTGLLREVVEGLAVPVAGVISDGQHPIRRAVARVLLGVPHLTVPVPHCASSTTSERQPERSTRPTATPKRSSKSACAGQAHRARVGGQGGPGSRGRARLLPGGKERDHRRWTSPAFGLGQKASRPDRGD
jgi:hypothetical protein